MICEICPRKCGVERGIGFCGMGENPVVARAALHFDEEPVISGTRGSGAVFFSGCSLRCLFCQNMEISRERFGKEITIERLREIYSELVKKGCHNINLVNPTHFSDAIYESLKGFSDVPVVWNSGGYELAGTLERFEGVVSAYLPDLKYVSPDLSKRYSGAGDYFDVAAKAIKEMVRQTGRVKIGEDDTIASGTIIRHLILPGHTDDSIRVLEWIADNAPEAWVSLMAQYMPMGYVSGVDELERRIMRDEYDEVCERMFALGLENGYVQELESSDARFIPTFDLTGV